MKVVSLIPSATEIVHALGMGDTLVGRSHCCDHPPEVARLPVLSRPKMDPSRPSQEIDDEVRGILSSGDSVYEILMEPLLEADPDVVLTQDHCDACAVSLGDVRQAVACAELADAEVCALHPHDLAHVAEDFRRVARALAVPERGDELARGFQVRLDALEERTAAVEERPSVLLLEWLAPPMVAGGWIPEIAWRVGVEPVLVTDARSFLEVEWEELIRAGAERAVLLPCGFGVERTLAELDDPDLAEALERLEEVIPDGVWVVDGDAYFNRPGPRLADSAELLATLMHPGLFGDLAERFGPQDARRLA